MPREKFSERSKRSWGEATSGPKFDVMPLLMLVIATPILLILFIFFGIFTIGSLIQFLTNIWVICSLILLNVLLYVANRLSVMSSIVVGLIVAIIAFIYPLAQTCAATGIFCILAVGIQGIFTSIFVLPGMALGAILVSSLAGLALKYIG